MGYPCYDKTQLVETHLARLRFLYTRIMKGERITQDDIVMIQDLKEKMFLIFEAIDDIESRLIHD